MGPHWLILSGRLGLAPGMQGKVLLGALGALLLLPAYIYWCELEFAEVGILLPRPNILACCSACRGSELVGGLLEEALPDHTIFLQESSLALLAKCSSSYGIPDAVEGFTLNPYLMT